MISSSPRSVSEVRAYLAVGEKESCVSSCFRLLDSQVAKRVCFAFVYTWVVCGLRLFLVCVCVQFLILQFLRT